MNLEKHYTEAYNKYYRIFERLSRINYVTGKKTGRDFNYTFNKFGALLTELERNRFKKFQSDGFNEIYRLFENSGNYEENPIENIFKNEIQTKSKELGLIKENYSFLALIDDVACYTCFKTICSYYSLNNHLLKAMYKENDFSDFGIYSIHDEHYKTLMQKYFPENDEEEIILISNTKDNPVFDTSQQVLLFEELLRLEKWDDLSSLKKAQIIHLLTGKSTDNIRKVYDKLNKKPSETSQKLKDDQEKIKQFIDKNKLK